MATKPKIIKQIEKNDEARLNVLSAMSNPYEDYFFVSEDVDEGMIFEPCAPMTLETFEIRMLVSDYMLVKVSYK